MRQVFVLVITIYPFTSHHILTLHKISDNLEFVNVIWIWIFARLGNILCETATSSIALRMLWRDVEFLFYFLNTEIFCYEENYCVCANIRVTWAIHFPWIKFSGKLFLFWGWRKQASPCEVGNLWKVKYVVRFDLSDSSLLSLSVHVGPELFCYYHQATLCTKDVL